MYPQPLGVLLVTNHIAVAHHRLFRLSFRVLMQQNFEGDTATLWTIALLLLVGLLKLANQNLAFLVGVLKLGHEGLSETPPPGPSAKTNQVGIGPCGETSQLVL
jgi:hypothetical protein